jgi:hypothetical protein
MIGMINKETTAYKYFGKCHMIVRAIFSRLEEIKSGEHQCSKRATL